MIIIYFPEHFSSYDNKIKFGTENHQSKYNECGICILYSILYNTTTARKKYSY
jgi:hypothetical protein